MVFANWIRPFTGLLSAIRTRIPGPLSRSRPELGHHFFLFLAFFYFYCSFLLLLFFSTYLLVLSSLASFLIVFSSVLTVFFSYFFNVFYCFFLLLFYFFFSFLIVLLIGFCLFFLVFLHCKNRGLNEEWTDSLISKFIIECTHIFLLNLVTFLRTVYLIFFLLGWSCS